jgi:hypothetical protein
MSLRTEGPTKQGDIERNRAKVIKYLQPGRAIKGR